MGSTEFTRTAPDGVELALREWEPAGADVRGGVYLLHGLGEHLGRYEELAGRLCADGWRVRGHDLRGHGRSAGVRGVFGAGCDLRCEATPLVAEFARDCGGAPVLFGHSMGGALAAQMVLSGCVRVRALVLSSPALALKLGRGQLLLAALLARLAPDLGIPNGLRAELLSHDPVEVQAYRDDPLVHRLISARLLRWLIDAGALARTRAPQLAVPTLLLHAGAERTIDGEGARDFARAAPSALLEVHEFAGAYHELFHEAAPWRGAAFDRLQDWLARQVAGAAIIETEKGET